MSLIISEVRPGATSAPLALVAVIAPEPMAARADMSRGHAPTQARCDAAS